MSRVLMPLPSLDFDPSEAGVTWRVLTDAGHTVELGTPDGRPARPDQMMLSGEGLDLWSRVPVLGRLRLLGLMLRADRRARAACQEMQHDLRFLHPQRYEALAASDYDALVLPGGHRARGMRPYLESESLQKLVAAFFEAKKPVAAICHGVVLAARSRSGARSVLYGRKTTGLTWRLEGAAWRLMRWAGRTWDANYYRTYPELPGEVEGYRGVQAEVSRALASPGDFLDAPVLSLRKSSGLWRDSPSDDRPAFVVRDGLYLSARWPGDVHTFARTFAEMLEETQR